MRTEGGRAKEIRGEGLSQAVVKIVRTYVFCKRHGIECVDEQLLATQEVLFSVTLIVIHCNGFTVHIGRNIHSSYSTISFDESVYHSLS